jgi:hypothetical protein
LEAADVVSAVKTRLCTESRDYAYFITGIRKLKLEIALEKKSK